MALAHEPVAGLRVRIAFRIRIVDCRNMREMLILQAVALVVLVAEPAKKFGERELDSLGFALIPRRGAEIVATSGRVHRLHLLDADYAREIIARRFDFRRRRNQSDRARGACSLVTAGRQSRELRIYSDEERADMTLLGIELSGEVAD